MPLDSAIHPALPTDHPLTTRDASRSTAESPLVTAYRGGTPSRTPVWFMRQAGRSLPEYRAVREGIGMLESCLKPELAAEITLQPVRRHDVDAAIFFSDIVIPLKLAGVDVDIVPGVGPVLGSAVRTAEDVAALPQLTDEALEPIREAVRLTVAELGSTPLIGFAGAPFTVAAYMVEGRPSRDHLGPRTMMHSDPEAWGALAAWAADAAGRFLRAQIEAGASAGQLFDSWAGSLSVADYVRHVQPHSARALGHVRDLARAHGVPLVHFGTGTSELLPAMRDAGASVMGVDYRLPLGEAHRRLAAAPGPDGRGAVPLQGNIDPALLAAPWDVLEAHVREVVEAGREAPGHVVNLGHGVPPTTDPDVLTRVVELVHSLRP
ncbi:uroporphyrinogen decarboxylase [Citricoccus sp. SGAir0253]|uniref:uroporphyrinogen decarboxylase n=1 Tax=Citricoccus sp. SGAir0253 TaxID=2567881 RepID=UPI0010CCBDF2|nr:uroporphyrinogen decarboxylase [Citricoccus sp. SGAir0253]QCU77712.1 uroporphyrinogen decarboxylase [Citricoccus sp. SGAir0253]